MQENAEHEGGGISGFLSTPEGKIAAATCCVGVLVALAQLGLEVIKGTLADPKAGLPTIEFPQRELEVVSDDDLTEDAEVS